MHAKEAGRRVEGWVKGIGNFVDVTTFFLSSDLVVRMMRREKMVEKRTRRRRNSDQLQPRALSTPLMLSCRDLSSHILSCR